MPTREYILGTYDAELDRLGLQHRIWRPRVLELWRDSGITHGSRVIDVGCGPGFATADLAEMVGPKGSVTAVEISPRYLAAAKALCQSRNVHNVTFLNKDLAKDDIDVTGVDVAWCRWVASFVTNIPRLVQQITSTLRPGGLALFHEYIDYRTMKIVPRRPAIDEFVKHVIASWLDIGGEPDPGLVLPTLLTQSGFKLLRATPICLAARPHELTWQWPASFIDTYVYRLADLGRVDKAWAHNVRQEFHAAESDAATLVLTPMLLEIVAQRL
jgi:SAM-dependent methyltransferase